MMFIEYLKNLKIKIDYNEFIYQFNSNPYNQSLLALSDTLSFFKIDNAAFKIEAEDLDYMPNVFLALTQIENEAEDFSFIKKVHDKYIVNEKAMSKSDFIKIFKNIVLIAEKSDHFEETTTKKYQPWLVGLVFAIMVLPVFLNGFHLFNGIFFVLSIFGFYLSYETFNQTLGINNSLTSKFCSSTPKSSCESVVKSNKWKIFKVISLSDSSLVFFSTQLLLISLFSYTNQFNKLVDFSAYFVWSSILLVLLSIYYQKFVEKNGVLCV